MNFPWSFMPRKNVGAGACLLCFVAGFLLCQMRNTQNYAEELERHIKSMIRQQEQQQQHQQLQVQLQQQKQQPVAPPPDADNEPKPLVIPQNLTGLPVTNVLLYTYMRGGSSLLGEMFNQNPEAFYWFEPIDGFYSHLYGTAHGVRPLDLYFLQNGTVRDVPVVEESTVLRGLQDMFACNLHELPVDVLTNRNLLTLTPNTFKPYADCLETANKGDRIKLKFHPLVSGHCKQLIKDTCPAGFRWTPEFNIEKCHETVYPAHENIRKGREEKALVRDSLINLLRFFVNGSKTNTTYGMANYTDCMSLSHVTSRPCLSLLEQKCRVAKIRAIKVIRLRMSMLESIITNIPSIKIVVQFRDPRATVVSRSKTGLISQIVSRSRRREGRFLCQRMKEEIKILDHLEKKYPNNIIHVKYEDMALEKKDILEDVYKFIGWPVPLRVKHWFCKNMDGPGGQVAGAYKTSGKNATWTANSWRNQVTVSENVDLMASCVDVLNILGYERAHVEEE